ncbi:MAG: hypothetical protein LBK22_04775, partial [Tannerella sp.]|jgi:hypothetical protein|nr:hypothetical protein [Tannerella sp.]
MHQNLLELFDEHNKEKKMLVGISIAKSTYNKYRITRDHLAAYVKEWHHRSDIPLKGYGERSPLFTGCCPVLLVIGLSALHLMTLR